MLGAATLLRPVGALAARVGTAKAHCPSRPVVTPLQLVVVVLGVITTRNKGRLPSSVLLHQLEAAAAGMPRPGVETPVVLVVLVVAAAAAVVVVVVQAGREIAVVPQGRTVVAVVAVLVVLAATEVARTMLVTVAEVHRPRLVVRLLREPAAVVVEAALSTQAVTQAAAPTRVLVVLEAAAPAVPVVSAMTGQEPAAAPIATRSLASLGPVILVAAAVVAAAVASRREGRVRVLVGPALSLLGISRLQCQRPVVA